MDLANMPLSRRRFITTTTAGLAIVQTSRASAAPDPLGPPSYVKAFELAFQPGFTWPGDDPKVRVPFKIIDGGKLTITSGEIVACDPFLFNDFPALVQKVPLGSHPIRFSHPMMHGDAGGRVAFARIDFSTKPVASWKMALTANNDPATLQPDYIFGYPVDAGTGSFFDRQAGAELLAQLRQGKIPENFSEPWITAGEIEGNKRGMSYYLEVPIPPNNIIMFTSGWGDGYYASYFGYDADGTVATLLTDFQVLDWSQDKLP
jgi:Protein of unknown function (DUF4241)